MRWRAGCAAVAAVSCVVLPATRALPGSGSAVAPLSVTADVAVPAPVVVHAAVVPPSPSPTATRTVAKPAPKPSAPTSPAARTVRPAAVVARPAIPTLSLTDEAEQVLFVGTTFGDANAPAYAASGAGGLWFLGQPASGQGPTVAAANARITAAGPKVRPFVATDEEGGGVARLSHLISPLPWQRSQAATYTPAQLTPVIAGHARAMAGLGFDLDFAPVVDTAPANDTIGSEGERSYSEDGGTAAAYGIASVQGWEQGGILPVLKHFPGLGHANANTDEGPATDPPLSQLQTDDLIPFQRGAAAGAPAVMMSHAIVPGLTDGQPTSMAPAAYTYLRSTLGFQGLAMTDSLDAGAISAAHYTQASAAVQALVAGADLLLVDHTQQGAVVSAIVAAVQSGHLSQSRLEAAVAAVLRAKHVVSYVDPHGCTVGAASNPGSTKCLPSRTLHR